MILPADQVRTDLGQGRALETETEELRRRAAELIREAIAVGEELYASPPPSHSLRSSRSLDWPSIEALATGLRLLAALTLGPRLLQRWFREPEIFELRRLLEPLGVKRNP